MSELQPAVETIVKRRREVAAQRALLVALSGIDGAGKGYLANLLLAELDARPFKTVCINIDGWLHLPERRFNAEQPGLHFYEAGIRFSELFEQLILPLKARRSISLEAQLADATNANAYRTHRYEFHAVDIILLEGIFLLKQAFRAYYDLAIWIECSFETALRRALQRRQEGLSDAEMIRDYHHIYFAAQRIHLAADSPHEAADLVILNDDRPA